MLIELSYIISLDMPKWPTNPAERIEYNKVIQNRPDSDRGFSLYKTISSGNCKRKRGENSI